MKDFVGNLYHYYYCAQKANNDQIDDDSDNEIIVSVEWENVFCPFPKLYTLQSENLVGKKWLNFDLMTNFFID